MLLKLMNELDSIGVEFVMVDEIGRMTMGNGDADSIVIMDDLEISVEHGEYIMDDSGMGMRQSTRNFDECVGVVIAMMEDC